jgi:hypothetical protein
MAMSGAGVPGYMGGPVNMNAYGGNVFGNNARSGAGLSSFFSGMFGDSGKPFQMGMDQLQKYFPQAQSYQNPFFNAGQNAVPQYQDFLSKMKDPSAFLNNMMGQYQESPWAKFQQQQMMRSAQNMGSANGLTGSTPLMQFAQQNARDISSQDQGNWLQNALGINTAYGAGLGDMMTRGQGASNVLSQLTNEFGQNMAQGEYGRGAGRQQDFGNMTGGLIDMIMNGVFA